MIKSRAAFEFFCKKRAFSRLFVAFTLVYAALFLGLLVSSPGNFESSPAKQLVPIGTLLSISGGLFAASAWKIVTWQARLSMKQFDEGSK